jgi:hypothetical protein
VLKKYRKNVTIFFAESDLFRHDYSMHGGRGIKVVMCWMMVMVINDDDNHVYR